MKKVLTLLAVTLLLVLAACSQPAPQVNEDTGLEPQKLSGTGTDAAWDVVANANHVYVSGTTSGRVSGSTSSGGVFLRQYTVAGKPVWTKQFGGANGYGANLALDASGNVYIAASLNIADAPKRGLSLRKYSKSGTLLWSKTFGDTAVDTGLVIDLELRGSTLYVLTGKSTSRGFVVYRYDTRGTALGRSVKTDPAVFQAIDMTFDKRGNMIVATKTGSIESNNAGIKVLRYSPNGQQTGSISVDTNRNDVAKKVVVDSKNNLYIAWEQLRDTTNIAKYDANFRRVSNIVIDSAVAGFPETNSINDMIITADDSLLLTGSTTSAFSDFFNRGGTDAYSLSVNVSGPATEVRYNSAIQIGTKGEDIGYGIAVAGNSFTNKTFVVGETDGNFKSPASPARNNKDAFIVADSFEWFDQ
jgi:hypothetical protein